MAEEVPVVSKVVSLSPTAHKGFRVKQNNSAKHLKDSHIVRVSISEYGKAGNDYPIVFVKDPESDQFLSAVLWGIDNGENLFVDGDKWTGGYVPAVIRCLPFTMAANTDHPDRLFIGLYEDSTLLGKGEDDGELIFDDEGKETKWMTDVKDFLVKVYQAEQHTFALVEKLDKLGLLVSQAITITLPGSKEEKNVGGFFIVDRAKLEALSDEDFLSLKKANYLEAIYNHLSSLDNIEKVLSKKKA